MTLPNEVAISKIYELFQSAVSAVYSAVGISILLDLGVKALDKALQDGGVLAAGAAETITVRQSLLRITAIQSSLELPCEKIKLDQSEPQFQIGCIEKRVILAEFFSDDLIL